MKWLAGPAPERARPDMLLDGLLLMSVLALMWLAGAS